MRYQIRFDLLLLSILLLTACLPPEMSSESTPAEIAPAIRACEEVIDEKLTSFPFGIEAETARVWIETEYQLTPEDVRFDLSSDGAQSMLKWKPYAKRTYNANLWNDTRESALVWIRWDEQPPTVVEVLRCLGDPPLYRAFLSPTQTGDWTYLELWYPERGIKVTAYVTRKVPEMTINQAIANIAYVQPGPPEDLITRFFPSTTRHSDRYVERLKGLKPWPGDITKITIDERG